MAAPLFSVGGLFSGLDTAAIIDQLMAIERIPVQRLQERQNLYQAKVEAWQSVRTRFSALESAAAALKDLSDFSGFSSATSSDEGVVSASVGPGASPGSLSFTVNNLAAGHQTASATSFSSPDDVVGSGTFTITVGSTSYDFTTTTSTTLSQLARQINDSDAGVSASVVSTDGSSHKLVLTASKTGTASQFTAIGTQSGLGSFDIVQQAEDAVLTIGSGTGALTITRSSNVVTDLMPGVTLTLKKESATPVTVTVERDLDKAVESVRKFVDEANSAISTLADLTRYDATSRTAGLLQGDSTARTLLTQLRTNLTSGIDVGGSVLYPATAGISLGRDGTLQLDETALREALENDFDSVARLFARSGSAADPRMEFASATDSTDPGSYPVVITRAAAIAGVTGATYAAPTADVAFTLTSGGTTASIVVTAGATLAEAVAAINSALDDAGITSVRAYDDGAGHIALAESRYGSAFSFTVSGSGSLGLDGTFAGVDVAGTINGLTATGSGRTLRLDLAEGQDDPAKGLAVTVYATADEVAAAGGTLSLGNLDYSQGLAGRIAAFVDAADAATGAITTASDRWESQIELVKDQIAGFEVRLELKERSLRAKFTAMEAALARLSGQASWLAAMFTPPAS